MLLTISEQPNMLFTWPVCYKVVASVLFLAHACVVCVCTVRGAPLKELLAAEQ